ncbi:hypothetical protein AB0O82_32770 [Kitasatospora sp. NPDC088264]|uniref:hypothetical protein n=1 Tax=Kitasatospora sp. NPDC088264 TaxID=3155296 RepID=UPI0034298357
MSSRTRRPAEFPQHREPPKVKTRAEKVAEFELRQAQGQSSDGQPEQGPVASDVSPVQAALALVEMDPEGVGQAVIGTDPRAAAIVAARLDPGAAVAAVAALGNALPDPSELDAVAEDDNSELTEDQVRLRAACDGAIEAAQGAADASVWTIGRALDVMAKQRLHRKSHPTLDAYVQDKVGKKYRQTKRWRDGWPLANAAVAMCPIGHIAPNEGQVRELLGAEEKHSREVAAELYAAVVAEAGQQGARVTAVMVAAARDALPDALPQDRGSAMQEAAQEAVRASLQQAGSTKPQKARKKAASVPPARKEQQSGAPAMPWGDPLAVYRLLFEHMPDHLDDLTDLLVERLHPDQVAAAVG